ncbi:MAG TPA: hypothetical protein VGM30_10465 [Puia sp.]|jgi:hypothetical protein
MANFDYYIDRKFTIWDREHYQIVAKDQQEANTIMLEHFNCGAQSDKLTPDDYEDLLDTREDLTPEENDGEATRELFTGTGGAESIRLADNIQK